MGNSLYSFDPHIVNPPRDTSLPAPSSSQPVGSIMASEMPLPVHVSPYGPPAQGNGNGQPYLPQPEQSQGSQDGQTSNQYPQYSYDIPKTPHVPTLRRHLSSQALSYRLCLSPDKIM